MCPHCLYNCGPHRSRAYITEETAEEAFQLIRANACSAVHIGGGEPLLDPDSVYGILSAARRTGVDITYIETNSIWYRGRSESRRLLTDLFEMGLRCLLVSISPFHNASIPLYKTRGVMETCREVGIEVFPWTADFLPDLGAFDDSKLHALDEYINRFGADYLASVFRRYWVHLGGRALETFRPVLPSVQLDKIIRSDNGCGQGCRELQDTSHFHIDLYGNYVPGLCSGLAFPAHLLGGRLESDRFPVLTRLFNQGVAGLHEWAGQACGFEAQRETYINKCDLCLEIRCHLTSRFSGMFEELAPQGFYADSLSNGH